MHSGSDIIFTLCTGRQVNNYNNFYNHFYKHCHVDYIHKYTLLITYPYIKFLPHCLWKCQKCSIHCSLYSWRSSCSTSVKMTERFTASEPQWELVWVLRVSFHNPPVARLTELFVWKQTAGFSRHTSAAHVWFPALAGHRSWGSKHVDQR